MSVKSGLMSKQDNLAKNILPRSLLKLHINLRLRCSSLCTRQPWLHRCGPPQPKVAPKRPLISTANHQAKQEKRRRPAGARTSLLRVRSPMWPTSRFSASATIVCSSLLPRLTMPALVPLPPNARTSLHLRSAHLLARSLMVRAAALTAAQKQRLLQTLPPYPRRNLPAEFPRLQLCTPLPLLPPLALGPRQLQAAVCSAAPSNGQSPILSSLYLPRPTPRSLRCSVVPISGRAKCGCHPPFVAGGSIGFPLSDCTSPAASHSHRHAFKVDSYQ